MRLSENSNKLFEEFFNQCNLCEGFEFPKVNVFARRGAWLLTNVLLVDGITIGKHIFVNPRYVWRGSTRKLRIEQKLMAHEFVHVLQYERLGFAKFLWVYVTDFWRIFRQKEKWNFKTWFESYLEIPHEIEARKFADEFMDWIETSDSSETTFPL